MKVRRCFCSFVPGIGRQHYGARWLIILAATSALYFVYYVQLFIVSNQFDFSNHLLAIGGRTHQQQQQQQQRRQVVVNRSRCCVTMSGRQQQQQTDVCGRPNCTRNCPDPVQIPSIDDSRANAFFLETSGSGTLNIRQACAVESLAFHNPNLNINVLFVGGQINASSSSIVDARKLAETYANIHPIGLDLDEYLAGTLLEKWYHCTDWRAGPYHVSHLSDGLRFLTLHKYGGYYFDLDVLILRSVTPFRNFVAVENQKDMGSGVIHADLGSPLMQLSVQDFAANYSAGLWTHNGPLLLLRVLRRWCNVDDVQSMDYIRCQGFHVLPSSSFCPVHYTQLGRLFDNQQQQQQQRPNNETTTDERNGTMTRPPEWLTDQVVGIHTWNKLSYNRPIRKNSTQNYNRLARHHCPLTYSLAPHVF